MLQSMCGRDTEALDRLDRVTKENSRQGQRTDLVYNIHEVKKPDGTSAAAALRRLRKDAPALHSQVMKGELSPHGAMVQAGLRPKTFTVTADPDRAAAALMRHFSPDEIAQIVTLLK